MDYHGYYKLDYIQRQNLQTLQTDKFWFTNVWYPKDKHQELIASSKGM